MRSYILTFILLINSVGYSQELSNKQRSAEIRSVNTDVINIINIYEAIFNDRTSNYDELKSIFSNSAKVVQDILPENKLDKTTLLDDYIKSSRKHHVRQKVNIRIDNIELVDSDEFSYSLVAKVSKYIEATTRNGIEYNEQLNDLLFYIKSQRNEDSESNNVFDSKIDSVISLNRIKTNYQVAYVVENDSIYNIGERNLILNNKTITSKPNFEQGNNYFFIKNLNKRKSNPKYDLDNAPFCFGLTPLDKSRYRDVRSLIKIKNRLLLEIKRPRFNISSSYHRSDIRVLKSNNYGITDDNRSNKLSEGGFEIGYFLTYKPKPYYHYLSLSLGIYKMSLVSNYQLNNYSYSYDDIDPAGNDYLRRVNIHKLNEDQQVNFLNLPLSIKYAVNVEEQYSDLGLDSLFILPEFFYVKISPTFHKNLNNSYNTSANISYSGFYQDAFNIEIDENGVYDFGDYQLAYDYQNELAFDDYFSTTLCVGFQKRLSRDKDELFLDFEYVVNFALTSPFESNPEFISRNSSDINSVYSLFDKISLNRNFIRFGLSYNF